MGVQAAGSGKQSAEVQSIDQNNVPWWTSTRLGLAFLGFLGFINVYALRVNMSVSVVCMVNHTAMKGYGQAKSSGEFHASVARNGGASSCLQPDGNATGNGYEDGELLWDKPVQGLVLSSFFWGYLVTQIPAGWLATKYGGKRIFGWSMLIASVATLLTPIAANLSYIFVIVIRIIIGMASGTVFPAMHTLWGNWAPPMERTKLVSFSYAGTQMGNVIAFPLSALLCTYGFAGGWPSVFYVMGTMSFLWSTIWLFSVSDDPAKHPRISKKEMRYIIDSLREVSRKDEEKVKIPWRQILTSLPVYAIVVSNICSDWGLYTLLTGIPTYMKEVLKFDMQSNGLFSALPYIGLWLVINVSAVAADSAQRRGTLTTKWTRRSFDAVGKILPAVLLIGLGYVNCTMPVTALTLLTASVSLTGFQFSGYMVNHVDIAPSMAGILFGISNSFASITGFVSPIVTAILTRNASHEEWQKVFYISGGVYCFGALFFLFFASGKVQDWAKETSPEHENLSKQRTTLLEKTAENKCQLV